jgi:tetratricopeptide (TPR) repeat protein
MRRLLIIVAYVLAFVGLAGAALLVASFSESLRQQYGILNVFYLERTPFLVMTVAACVVAYGAKLWSDLLRSKPALESVHAYGGQLSQKATRHGMERELADAGGDFSGEAGRYFQAAEKVFSAKRYREARDGYQSSLDAQATMSGYLNLGLSLMYLCEFHRAEEMFSAGIHMARKLGYREFEGAFLINLGNTYFREGKHDKALQSYRAALKFCDHAEDSVARAAIFHNSGIVFHAQAQLDEAFPGGAR